MRSISFTGSGLVAARVQRVGSDTTVWLSGIHKKVVIARSPKAGVAVQIDGLLRRYASRND